ncbi:DsbA family oxidoreductase [Streptomyces filamentosus]
MTTADRATVRVEITLDLTCVHSYLGFTRFERAARRHRDAGGTLDVTFLPFRVSPDAPAAGRPLSEVHAEFFGSAENAARATAGMAETGAREGLEFDFAHAVHVDTFEAHRLLAAAGEQGLAEPMAERLFRAYLTDGLNIGDAATLTRLAAEIGVRRAETGPGADAEASRLRAELDRVRALGVRSVPLFRFEGAGLLSGAQPEEAFRRAIEAAARHGG